MKHPLNSLLPALAAMLLGACQITPPSSNWATDVYRARFATLRPGMTTDQVLSTMCTMAGPRTDGRRATWDLVDGYALTLFFGDAPDRPQEVVLHTPYDTYPTNWTRTLSAAELDITRPLR